MIVHYETLVREPERIRREVCEFLNEEFTPDMLSMEGAVDFREKLIRRGSLKPGESLVSPDYIGLFRQRVPKEDIAFMQSVVGTDMAANNYALEPIRLSGNQRLKYYLRHWPVELRRMLAWLTVGLAMIGLLRVLGLAGRLPRARAARRRRKSFRSRAEALKLFMSGRGIFKTWSPEFVEAYLECGLLEKEPGSTVLTCDPELEAQIFESIPITVWRYVRRLRCPVLAIHGEQSDVFLAEAADRLQRVAGDAEVVTMAGTGHFPNMEKPSECAQAILEFLRRRIP